jgi:hypothetical protein
MTTILAQLLTLSCVLMLATDEGEPRAHDHDLLNARCPISGCYGTLRDGIGGGYGEKAYECSFGHRFVVKKKSY